MTPPSDQPAIHVAGGRLAVEGVDAEELAARFGTPLYVMSEGALRSNVRAWQQALAAAWRHGDTRVLVSLKANPSIALRRILNQEGAGCDVFGQAELEIALAAGVRPDLISVNGSTKPAQLIARAIDAGARLTVDSIEELETAAAAARAAGTVAAVRLRVRPDLTDVTTVSEFTEAEPLGAVADAYKPGIPLADLTEALPSLDLAHVDLLGLHAHLGRHTADPAPVPRARPAGRAAWRAPSARRSAAGGRARSTSAAATRTPGIRPGARSATSTRLRHRIGMRQSSRPACSRAWPRPGSTPPGSRLRSSRAARSTAAPGCISPASCTSSASPIRCRGRGWDATAPRCCSATPRGSTAVGSRCAPRPSRASR